jgi:hypothetical protein
MPVKTIAAAAPDEPPPLFAVMADFDDVAVDRALRDLIETEMYGAEFPGRYRPPVPVLTEAEQVEVARRLRAVRDRRNRSYRFVCSKAAAARRDGAR